MNITSHFNTSQHRRAFVMHSSCLRFLRRDNFAPKVEARGKQNGMKKSPTLYKVRAERACSLCRAKQRHEVTSPIRFSEEPILLRRIRIGFMLLKAACERRGVHFSAPLSKPSTGRFLHLRRAFVLTSLLPSLLRWRQDVSKMG